MIGAVKPVKGLHIGRRNPIHRWLQAELSQETGGVAARNELLALDEAPEQV